MLFLMQSLMADFVQFSSAYAKFLFLKGRMGTRLQSALNFEVCLIFPYFLGSWGLSRSGTRDGTRTFSSWW